MAWRDELVPKNMPKKRVPYALAGLAFALALAATSAAKAEFFGCDDQHHASRASYASVPSYRAGSSYTHEFAAQSRPRVTMYPRHRAQRHCRSWLTKEYRISGPVIVPRMRCWWK
jgi:hypothetical protein